MTALYEASQSANKHIEAVDVSSLCTQILELGSRYITQEDDINYFQYCVHLLENKVADILNDKKRLEEKAEVKNETIKTMNRKKFGSSSEVLNHSEGTFDQSNNDGKSGKEEDRRTVTEVKNDSAESDQLSDHGLLIDPTTGYPIDLIVNPFKLKAPVDPWTGEFIPFMKTKRSSKGRASKAGIGKTMRLKGMNVNTITVFHPIDENWRAENPNAVMCAPNVFEEIVKNPASYTRVIHVVEKAKTVQLKKDAEECPAEECPAEEHVPSRGRPKGMLRLKTKTADAPKPLFKRSCCSASLLAGILYNKYELYLPYHRQAADFKLHNLPISEENIVHWTDKACKEKFSVLFNVMAEDAKVVLRVLHLDETRVNVLEVQQLKDRKHCYYVGLTSGCRENTQMSLYVFRETREGSFVTEILDKNRKYKVHADAYRPYVQDFITVAICHDHNRRHFVDALKAESGYAQYESLATAGGYMDGSVDTFLNKKGNAQLKDIVKILDNYKKLYANEKKYLELPADERKTLREKDSQPILDEIYEIVDKYHAGTPKEANKLGKTYVNKASAYGKALTYAKNQREGLYVYIHDGEMEISNVRQEQKMRPVAKLRDNSMFFDTVNGAIQGGIWMSFIQTCHLNGINAEKYLEYMIGMAKRILT